MPAPKEGGLLCGSLSWEKHHFFTRELQTVRVGERVPSLFISATGGKIVSLVDSQLLIMSGVGD